MTHRATQLVWLVPTQFLFLSGIQIETVLTHESWWISWTIVFDLQIVLVLPGSQLSFTEITEYICSRWPYPTLLSFTLVSSFAPPYTFVRSSNCSPPCRFCPVLHFCSVLHFCPVLTRLPRPFFFSHFPKKTFLLGNPAVPFYPAI